MSCPMPWPEPTRARIDLRKAMLPSIRAFCTHRCDEHWDWNMNYKECIYGMTEDDVKVIVEDDTKEPDDDGLIYECIYAQSANATRKRKSKHDGQIKYAEKKENKVICGLCYERNHWYDADDRLCRNPDERLHKTLWRTRRFASTPSPARTTVSS